MKSTIVSVFTGLFKYLIGLILVFLIFTFVFREMPPSTYLTKLKVLGSIMIAFLFVWRFWKGFIISIFMVVLIYFILKSGAALPAENPKTGCITDLSMKTAVL
jgi:hypothetical protein